MRGREPFRGHLTPPSLSSPRLIDAFLRCDRVRFVPETLCNSAYGDYPLQIGEGQTISQPTTVAIMLELLDPRPGDRVLDIGSGSGWTTALIACAVGETGFVEGVERLERLVAYGRRNLLRSGVKNASIEPAKPAVLGKPGELYDRILVSACAPKMPRELLEQLKIGGKLVMPSATAFGSRNSNREKWTRTKCQDSVCSAGGRLNKIRDYSREKGERETRLELATFSAEGGALAN